MKGYWLVAKGVIADQAAQDEYNRLWPAIAAKYQAKVNPSKTPPLLVEPGNRERVLVIEFPSLEMAKACYDDPDYQHVLPFAKAAAGRELIMFEGDLA